MGEINLSYRIKAAFETNKSDDLTALQGRPEISFNSISLVLEQFPLTLYAAVYSHVRISRGFTRIIACCVPSLNYSIVFLILLIYLFIFLFTVHVTYAQKKNCRIQ